MRLGSTVLRQAVPLQLYWDFCPPPGMYRIGNEMREPTKSRTQIIAGVALSWTNAWPGLHGNVMQLRVMKLSSLPDL